MRISDWSSDVCSSDLPAFHVRAVHGNGLHIVDVEEAILQAEVDVGRDRAANTSDRLPCELGVRIIDERRAVLGQLILGFLDASDTGATAAIAVPAVIAADATKGVEHAAQDAGIAVHAYIGAGGLWAARQLCSPAAAARHGG